MISEVKENLAARKARSHSRLKARRWHLSTGANFQTASFMARQQGGPIKRSAHVKFEMKDDRKRRAIPATVLASPILPRITRRGCGLSFFLADSYSRLPIERRETRRIVNAKDERLSCQSYLRETPDFRSSGVSSIRLMEKGEGKKGVHRTSRHLIRIPARRGDKSPPPKFARILAFALLVFASRAFERTSASALSFSIARLSRSRVANANSPTEQLFPPASDRFVEKEPCLSSVSAFRFFYPFIRLFMRPYI